MRPVSSQPRTDHGHIPDEHAQQAHTESPAVHESGILSGPPPQADCPLVEGGTWCPKTYARLPLHINHGLELVSIRAGHAQWLVDGRPHDVQPGDLFWTCPWHVHGSANELDPAIDLDWVVIPLTSDRPEPSLDFPQPVS